MKAKDYVAMFQGLDPDEEVIALVYTRDLFGDVAVSPTTGEEFGECPLDSWNLMAQKVQPERRYWLQQNLLRSPIQHKQESR